MKNHRKNPLITMQLCSIMLLTLIAAAAQAQTTGGINDQGDHTTRDAAIGAAFQRLHLFASARPAKRAGLSLMASSRYANANGSGVHMTVAATSASPPAVLGTGTVGRISKWISTGPSGNSILGDSIITELNGNIGIGLDTPTSKLGVQGMIETTLGGYKFPDGTIQTTAAVSGLQVVFHDQTLQGNGTQGSPLRVAIPLDLTTGLHFLIPVLRVGSLSGGIGIESLGGTAIRAIGNRGLGTADLGIGVSAEGAEGGTVRGGGSAVVANGGDSLVAGETAGGIGVEAFGGNAEAGGAGHGVKAIGGDGIKGGDGVSAVGGTSIGLIGGNGVHADGGDGISSGGGHGVVATGGTASLGHLGGIGIFAIHGAGRTGETDGDAGLFIGDVTISGNLDVTGTKNFKIDHPLDPEHKYLYHAAIESAEVLNLYSGNVRLDANGEATVKLPEWFGAVNHDIRYSLTPIGAPGQGLYIAEEVSNNRFKIAGGLPGAKVSWQVTGIRSDAAMRIHAFKAEEDKPERERGTYLDPGAFNQPEDRSVEWARNPELMRQLKERREQMRRKAQANNR
jgi:hypothetical protein